MQADEITEVRDLLDEFVQEVFGSFPRKDQRGKGGLYLTGLMLDGRRKSMQQMGDRLGIEYQQLQQFVSSSPWPVEPVRRILVRKAIGLIEPEAWVVDDTGVKKDGPASPGVARQYSGTLPTQKPTGQPELLWNPPRTPTRGHPDPRPLPLLQPTSRTNLTKYY